MNLRARAVKVLNANSNPRPLLKHDKLKLNHPYFVLNAFRRYPTRKAKGLTLYLQEIKNLDDWSVVDDDTVVDLTQPAEKKAKMINPCQTSNKTDTNADEPRSQQEKEDYSDNEAADVGDETDVETDEQEEVIESKCVIDDNSYFKLYLDPPYGDELQFSAIALLMTPSKDKPFLVKIGEMDDVEGTPLYEFRRMERKE